MSLVKKIQPIFWRWKNGPETDGWVETRPTGTVQTWCCLTNLTQPSLLGERSSCYLAVYLLMGCGVKYYSKKEKPSLVRPLFLPKQRRNCCFVELPRLMPLIVAAGSCVVFWLDQIETTANTWYIANTLLGVFLLLSIHTIRWDFFSAGRENKIISWSDLKSREDSVCYNLSCRTLGLSHFTKGCHTLVSYIDAHNSDQFWRTGSGKTSAWQDRSLA